MIDAIRKLLGFRVRGKRPAKNRIVGHLVVTTSRAEMDSASPLLTFSAGCKLMGKHPKTVERDRNGGIYPPFVWVGGRRFFYREQVEKFLADIAKDGGEHKRTSTNRSKLPPLMRVVSADGGVSFAERRTKSSNK